MVVVDLKELAQQFNLPALGRIGLTPMRLIVDGWSEDAEKMARFVSRQIRKDVFVIDWRTTPRAHPFLQDIVWVGDPLISYWPPGRMSNLPSMHVVIYPLGGFLI